MNSKMEMAELRCMDPDNYRKCFRALCWSGTRKLKRPFKQRSKKTYRGPRSVNPLAVCYAPALLHNPSQFSVYATVRKSVLARWCHMHGATNEYSDDSDTEDPLPQLQTTKVPKVTSVGLRAVFELLGIERHTNVNLCENALTALLDILQGFAPEELAQESPEILSNISKILKDYATDERTNPRLISLGVSCLASLAVAKGEVEDVLDAVATFIRMDRKHLANQSVKIPLNILTLQRSVQSVILGPSSRNQWLNYGVPIQSLITSFPLDLPTELDPPSSTPIYRSMASDGGHIYMYTTSGILKYGTGYESSIKQHIYVYHPYCISGDEYGWLGICDDKLYLKRGRYSTKFFVLDKETFKVINSLKLDVGTPTPIDAETAVFSDGTHLGLVMLTDSENLTIRLYEVPDWHPEAIDVKSCKELTVPLMRRRTLSFGRAAYEDGFARRGLDNDPPAATQLDDNEDDPLTSISGGQDFGVLTTTSGKVYYTGKGASLGFKLAPLYSGKWTMMKDSHFNKTETPSMKKFKVIQIAVGHEGVHAVAVLDNGTAMFMGIARRGEDGDSSKHRRAPKPTKPKKIFRAEGHYIVYAACNNGSTALVTRQGVLLMFGKDTQHCDSNGVVHGLKKEKVTQVALGKAHAVVLTNLGQVFTFGINNKGQCGREFGYTKEKHHPKPPADEGTKEEVRMCQEGHTWFTDICRVCVQCRECTGFAGACKIADTSNRVPGEKCGCGEGDAGCHVCGICRECAKRTMAIARAEAERAPIDEDDGDLCGREEVKEAARNEGQASGSDMERDASCKVTCLPPAKIAIPGGHKITNVACGLHHTVLLTITGEVLTFGSNQYGQLGAGDVIAHHRIIRVRIPEATTVSAGSNHTAVLTKAGELYTFGHHQKGALGRSLQEQSQEGAAEAERSPVWYATPEPVPNLGPRFKCKGIWLSACGDQTFVQIAQALISRESLFSATIVANSNSIVILPNEPEHTFKCITINKSDATVNTWTGPEQVDFVNTLACLDPHYAVIWCFQPITRVLKCFNILAFDSHKLQRCCNPDSEYADNQLDCLYPNVGALRRLEEFKNMENFVLMNNIDDKPVECVAFSNNSILNQELAIPVIPDSQISRMHLALHLLGCLDSLTYAHDNKLSGIDCKRDTLTAPAAPLKADYLTVTRFKNHGGGWGYSGHSVEAIRFMCDADILLGGYGLFGGRGDYTAKIKLYDIGNEGGDQEGDGEAITETDEIMYDCAPRDRYPIMFDSPIPIVGKRWYVAWACINGPSSDCGSAGQPMVFSEEIGFHFKTSKRSNNGTDVNAGQIPSLIYNVAGTDNAAPPRVVERREPYTSLIRNVSRRVTVACFKTILLILHYCWDTLHYKLLDTNDLVPCSYWILAEKKKQRSLVFIIRAALRLAKSYINEICPQNNKRRNTHENVLYYEPIGEIKTFIQSLLSFETPTCAMLEDHPGRSKKSINSKICYVQFSLELTNGILKESQRTFSGCFYAFCPTPALKWEHFVRLLRTVKNGKVPQATMRELIATCAAMCSSGSLHDVLQFIVPATHNTLSIEEAKRPESKVVVPKDVPSKSATVPRLHGSKPPPIPPRSHQRDNQRPSTSRAAADSNWHLMDVIRCLLDIVMLPIKGQMMTQRQRGQTHDHGELRLQEQLVDYCCKLTVRIIAQLSYSTVNIRDLESTTLKQLVTPSRFMRMNQSRSWNTGNGSPDAICFTVNRPGVTLVGACVYSGAGTYEYTLELLHDMRQSHGSVEEANSTNCWVSVDTVSGTFNGTECSQDIAQLKFDRPIPLKEDFRYAIRLCNHGARTANGDCGLPSVKGTDGTTFRFASCSLSFNGTTLARGQIPCLIYYASQTRSFVQTTDSVDTLVTTLRAVTLRVSSFILERTIDLFFKLHNELTAEDLRRNAAVLQQSPVVNTLLPYCLANLDEMDDSKSVIKLLELIRKLLPHVTTMNHLVPAVEEFTTTTTDYYTWVESDHPYLPANVTNKRVLFPPGVSWIVLEMDPRSVTVQPEDTLTIYAVAGTPKPRCHCQNDVRVGDPPFRKRFVTFTADGELEDLPDEPDGDNACMHYNCIYVSVTPKLANVASDWPQKALLIPGNEVIFSLETATDYLTEYNKATSDESRFGFRCLCTGYKDMPITSKRQGLSALEMELVYAGASYASKLLAPDLDMPPMVFSTLVDVQLNPYNGPSEGDDQDQNEALLLSRGLELSSPPTVHQVLDGQPLLRKRSNKSQIRVLVDYMSTNEYFATGEFTGPLGTRKAEAQWLKLKNLLSSYGPDRSIEQWKQTWKDLKKNARHENALSKQTLNATGNLYTIPIVSENSKKILDTIGHESSIGIGPAESAIGALCGDSEIMEPLLLPPAPFASSPTVPILHSGNFPHPLGHNSENEENIHAHHPARTARPATRPHEDFLQLQQENNSILQNIATLMAERSGLLREQNKILASANDIAKTNRCVSTERQFLIDFIAGAESTAGGRLAHWLGPTPQVDPSKCEFKCPQPIIAHPNMKLTVPILVKDQYDDPVVCPSLKVEVIVQKIDEPSRRHSRPNSSEGFRGNVPTQPFLPCVKDTMRFNSITMMKDVCDNDKPSNAAFQSMEHDGDSVDNYEHIQSLEQLMGRSRQLRLRQPEQHSVCVDSSGRKMIFQAYHNISFEELRLSDGTWSDAATAQIPARIPAERLVIRPESDGQYIVTWIPKVAGVYAFRCTLDDIPAAQELMMNVTENLEDNAGESGTQITQPQSPPLKRRRFNLEHSAGLRIRASPSLLAEVIGRVDPGEDVTFIEQIINSDGTWVRLSEESLAEYTDSSVTVAWCLAHHNHLNRVLLERLETETPEEEREGGVLPSCVEDDEEPASPPASPPPDANSDKQELENIAIANPGDEEPEQAVGEGQPGVYLAQPFIFMHEEGAKLGEPEPEIEYQPEPNKRDRQMRNEGAVGLAEPGRRINGNDWWEPVRHRPDNGQDDEEIEDDEDEAVGLYEEQKAADNARFKAYLETDEAKHDVVVQSYYAQLLYEPDYQPLRRPHFLPPGVVDLHAPPWRRMPKSPVLPRDASPEHKRAEPPQDGEEPPELQPKKGREPRAEPCAEPRAEPRDEPRAEPGASRQPVPAPQDPPPALRDQKPPVYRDQKPDLPLCDRAGSSRAPPHRDHGFDSPKKPAPQQTDKAFRENKGSPRHRSEPPHRDANRDQEPQTSSHSDPKPPEQLEPPTATEAATGAATVAATVAAGTQTSPDTSHSVRGLFLDLEQGGSSGSGSLTKEQRLAAARVHKRTSPPPPLPARSAPVAQPPKKLALSPAQTECLRAVFAASLWHEGIVHDAIACAAFLKFHPHLPKQGASVVTRPPHDVSPTRRQRHSVEVSNAGNYLRIQPSTLETLTRSGEEASASRARKSEVVDAIKEEDGQVHDAGSSAASSVVNVLPPALRALVALWDALYDSDQLSAATDKYRKPIEDVKGDEEPEIVNDSNLARDINNKKAEWRAAFLVSRNPFKGPYAVRCELCGGSKVSPPLASHMRRAHPGCRAPSQRGYDRAGIYKRSEVPPVPAPTDTPPSTCGQLAQVNTLWYVYCERCRDKTMKAASAKQTKDKAALNSNEAIDAASTVDYHIMKENAVFLLDLAPLTNSESITPWYESSSRGPPTPPGSVWQPAPPFQCLPALGAAPKAKATTNTARYHSLGRPTAPTVAPLVSEYGGGEASAQLPRVHRSVSMGQAGGRDLADATRPPLTDIVQEDQRETLSGAGSSLLAQPSAELQRLVGCGEACSASAVSAFEPPRVDPDMLIKSPVLSFILAKRDLPLYRQKMDAAVRINTVRQYAFEAMNWLLRSTTQPTCVHDVMWWFCTALDKYARLVPPPSEQDENKENAANEVNRHATPTASTAVICPGGRAARGARAAFHAFLGSVSALAPSLSPASATSLQAVRCWALHYSQEDRAFLHRSQMFNVISKILAHSEDVAYERDMDGEMHDSWHSFLNTEHYLWTSPDVTGWCDITVSSRAGMAGSLTDGSTETFWESGDEDRSKAKWIQVAYAGGNVDDRPSIICVHVDNTRDTMNKTLLVSFLYSGISGEMYHMHDMEVDPKVATWVCYTLPTCYPGASSGALRVRCELRGPEPSVRVRQVRVLSTPAPLAKPASSPARILHGMTEVDTLRVFRLLTSEVFGKLLEWERSGSESGEGPVDNAPADDSDLREHVVGILFAGHQLTSLQREVMTHIVAAIGAEAARVRDDWETALLCAEASTGRTDELALRPIIHQQDNYCFEMLSLLLALSGSQVGRSLLAQQNDLPPDLLALLHTGSERVQRQVISLLRRIITEIPPQRMLAVINPGSDISERITLLDHLLCYLGKAITVQMKVKGNGGSAPESVTMSSAVVQGPRAAWFMRGETTKKHAHLVSKLLADMAEEKLSPTWGLETRAALANYAAQVAQINETDRRPDRCIALPTMWMSLAALCVCEQAHIELLNGGEGRDSRSRESNVEPRSYCVNHDDGITTAVIECRTCGALCAECDRFLHLKRVTRAHHRQICKEEESAIRIDIHEGCGRAKLFWLLLLVDRRTLKGLAEFRGMDTAVGDMTTEPTAGSGTSGSCRFCGSRGSSGLLEIGNVCADQQCQEHGAEACKKTLICQHLCGGVDNEVMCLPCLQGCSREPTLRQDADDMCMICFTDPLQAAPAIQLGCGHVFHLHCCKKVLSSKWIGPRITFSFAQCPICKEDLCHWTLARLLAPIKRLREEVQRKALMRLEYEGLAAPGAGSGSAQTDPAKYAMERYAYYVCHKCEKAYFGGLARCEAESNGVWEPSELVCGACSDVASAKTCPKHGADFLEYKCRYCCSVAVFFCFGTSHFCNSCHDDFQRVTNIPRQMLPQCPAGPKGEQLPGSAEECPLHVVHPATGEEFALGCGVCRHAHVF